MPPCAGPSARARPSLTTRCPALLCLQGTLFVLAKEVTARDRLLAALAAPRRDDDLIAQLAQDLQARIAVR